MWGVILRPGNHPRIGFENESSLHLWENVSWAEDFFNMPESDVFHDFLGHCRENRGQHLHFR